MAVLAQVFTGTHSDAVARADALDADRPTAGPHVDLGVAPEDLEELGRIAARVVRFGTGDVEPVEIDLEHDRLFELPRYWAEVLAELTVTEEPDAVEDVAQAWAATEEMDGVGDLTPLVRDLAALAADARQTGATLYLWVAEA